MMSTSIIDPVSAKFSIELQAARGIAAMVVLVTHCSGVMTGKSALTGILNYLVNGSGAVTFFFVLSGFVLALSWGDRPLTLKNYLVFANRRGFRIFPMLAFAATLGTLYYNHVEGGRVYSFASEWFAELCGRHIDLARYLAALAGYSARPSPQLWSIFVEIVASALIPLMIAVGSSRARRSFIVLALVLLSLSGAPWCQYNWPVFLINFYVGISILWWGPGLAARARQLDGAHLRLILLALLLAFASNRQLLGAAEHADPIANLIEMAATAPIIAILFYHREPFALLRSRAATVLGNVSYSVYLTHFVVMIALVQLGASLLSETTLQHHPDLFFVLLTATTAIFTVAVSLLTYRWIELPGIACGRSLTAWMKSGRRPNQRYAT